MTKKPTRPAGDWVDPDDAPAWTGAMFDRAEIAEGGKVLRRATGTVTKRGRPKSASTKVQVSLRLDPQVLAALKRDGGKWQVTLNEVLANWAKRKKAAGKASTANSGAKSGTESGTESGVRRATRTPAPRPPVRKTGT